MPRSGVNAFSELCFVVGVVTQKTSDHVFGIEMVVDLAQVGIEKATSN